MKVCPICEGFTASARTRCTTCDAPIVDTTEVTWSRRDGLDAVGSPWIGRLVAGKYRVSGILGKGGMGTVYRAVHEVSLQSVALKVLQPRLASHQGFKDTLIAEARKASLLKSEHVARVIDVGETLEGSVFFAMEIVEGDTLDAWLREHGPLPVSLVIELMSQIAAALEDAQSAGVVHRDLSPKNIMLERRGDSVRAKILDFGIARLAGESPESNGPRAGLWINPPFTAPELLAGEPGDFRSDLYSLGVLAYEALSGRLPHGGATLEERVRAVREQEPARLVPGHAAPRGLVRLIRRLMAKDPADRPGSIAQVREVLANLEKPHSLWFQVASVVVLIAGSTSFLTSLRATRNPTLQSTSGSALIVKEIQQRDGPAQFVRREDLQLVRFQVVDVRPGELVVRGYSAGGMSPLFERPLRAPVTGGELVLNARTTPDWQAVVDACQVAGRVQLDFLHAPSNLLVGFASVFVDAETPELVMKGDVRQLRRDTKLQARLVEDGELARLVLELRDDEDRRLAWREIVSPENGELEITGQMLADGRLAGESLDSRDNLRLVWTLTDRAGRKGSGRWRFENVDLSIPAIEDVIGTGESTLEVDERFARVRVQLDRDEAQLDALHVETAVGEAEARPRSYRGSALRCDGRTLFARIEVPPLGEGAEVDVTLWIRDAAGNRSEPFQKSFKLFGIALEPRWALVGAAADSARLDPEQGTLYLAKGGRVRLHYTCNSSYLPSPVAAGLVLETPARAPGSCVLVLGPPAEKGRHELVMRHSPVRDRETRLVRKETLHVRCIGDPPSIRPLATCTAQTVWEPVVFENGVLEVDPDGVRLGAAVQLDVDADSGAYGRLWTARGDRWRPLTPRRALTGPQDLRDPLPIVHGRNRVALEVVDCLGRRLVDATPDADRRRVRVDGSELVLVADFVHDATPPQATDVDVEYDEIAVVIVREDQVFDPASVVELLYEGAEPYRFRATVVPESARSRCTFRLPFSSLREICNWQGILSAEDFLETAPRRRKFFLMTPAGRFELELTFQPTRTLLESVELGSLGAGGTDAIRGLRMVPFLAPPRDWTIDLGPPDEARTKGSIKLAPRVKVSDVGAFFLSSTEVSRLAYATFVADVIAGLRDGSLPLDQLRHHEDPLPAARRFTRQGLAPDLSLLAKQDLALMTARSGDRPVTGVHYYQAFAFVRWLGFRAFGDADLFRLPFGAELEWAALGRETRRDHPALNGLRPAGDMTLHRLQLDFRRAQQRARRGAHLDPDAWPANPAQLDAIGDYAVSHDGSRVYGLDFGVREWVEDLPLVDVPGEYRLIAGLHARHIDYAKKRSRGEELRVAVISQLENGEVRGLGWGEVDVSGADPLGFLADCYGEGDLRGLLGVKRMNYVRRDGRGLDGGISPVVRLSGFRVAGTEAFVRKARAGIR